MDNLGLLDTVSVGYSIQCISGALTITNDTFITNQSTFINSYLSTVLLISNLTIYDIRSDNNIFVIAETNLTLDNVAIDNLYTNGGRGKFIQVSFESHVVVSNIQYTNSNMKLIETFTSQMHISTLHMSNISLTQYAIDFTRCHNIKIENVKIYDISTTKTSMMYMAKSSINKIKNMTVNNINSTMLYILQSSITLIDDIEINDVTQSIHIKQSSIGMIQNSRIFRSGSSDILYGGALHIDNSNSSMQNLTLEHSIAQTGGAIHIGCDTYEICQNNISSSTFLNNTALKQGGAINYNFRRPDLSNNSFNFNEAAYGPIIASYPARIVNSVAINEPIVLTNVASGIAYHETISMMLVDYDDQVMNLVNNSHIKIVPVTINSKIKGVGYSVLTKGQAQFDNLQFVYGPGQTNIKYAATCDLIDSDKVSYLTFPTDNSIDVSFRYCQPGELVINNETCSE